MSSAWRVLPITAAIAGLVGTAGLSFDGSFDPRLVLYTLPAVLAAVAAGLRGPAGWSGLLLGIALGMFGIEARTASVNYEACLLLSGSYREVGVANLLGPCAPIGFLALVTATLLVAIAAILTLAGRGGLRALLWLLAGVVLAPLLLYVISIAGFAMPAR